MSQYAVTLKNLYRLLTVNDYPIFSNGVFSSKNRSGMTLTSFWRSILVPEWQYGFYGKELWNTSKSRYLSDFCNRKETVTLYDSYREEIFHSLSAELLIRQIHSTSDCLVSHHYDPEAFYKKMEFVINLSQDDPCFSKSDCRFFLKHYSEENRREFSEEFCDGWIFTMLAICAMCGRADQISAFMRMVQEDHFDVRSLYAYEKEMKKQILPFYRRYGEVYGAAEEAALFFGRQKELYDLCEAVSHGEKVLISGIGGIGKTELVRQLLAHLEKTGTSTEIISVQYEGSLRESFAGCFGSIGSLPSDDLFHECMYQIAAVKRDTTALIIDNAEISEKEKADWERITELPCPVVVTSREHAPKGFTELYLEELSEDAALLMLRRHYQKALSEQEKEEVLRQIRNSSFLRHPLTIRIIASWSGRNDWPIRSVIEKTDIQYAGERSEGYPYLKRIYRNLYQMEKLSENEQKLMTLLSCLPYGQYSLQQISQYSQLNETLKKTEEILNMLSKKGWMEKKEGAWSVHPLIAECISEDGFEEEQLSGFFAYIRTVLSYYILDFTIYDDMHDICMKLIHVFMRLKGMVSIPVLRFCVMAAVSGKQMNQFQPMAEKLNRLMSLYHDPEVSFLRMLTGMYAGESVSSRELMESYQNCVNSESIPEDVLVNYGIMAVNYSVYHTFDSECVNEIINTCETMIHTPFDRFRLHFMAFIRILRSYDLIKEAEYFKRIETEAAQITEEQKIETVHTMMQTACVQRALTLLFVSQKEESRECYAKRLKYTKAIHTSNYKMQEMEYEVQEARTEKRLQEALVKYDQLIRFLQEYYGNHHLNTLIQQEEKASVLRDLGRTEEAIQLYEASIGEIKENFPSYRSLHAMTCNLAAAYLDAGRAEEVIRLLEEDIMTIAEHHSIPYAEPCLNLAKAYRKLNDTANEVRYLQAACPVFEEVYGPEHKKTVYTKNRLQELVS